MAKHKYESDFPQRAEDFARQGLKDDQIAKQLGISRTTFYEYQQMYPDFSDAIKRGKAPVDFEVENALLKRAQGFEFEETHIELKAGKNKKGEEETHPKTIKKITKYVPPDTAACAFWLKNRRPKLWRDRHDIDLGGGATIRIITAVPRAPAKNPGPGEKQPPESPRVKRTEAAEPNSKGKSPQEKQ